MSRVKLSENSVNDIVSAS